MKPLSIIGVIILCYIAYEVGSFAHEQSLKSDEEIAAEIHMMNQQAFCDNIREYEYKNHLYILYHTRDAQCSVGGICHSPDCKCFSK